MQQMITTSPQWIELIENPSLLEFCYQQSDASIQKLALKLQKNHPQWPRHAILAQIQNIQKARYKLPAWVRAQCVFPTQAYEQATGQRAAALKKFEPGALAYDLGSGLGVDSWNLSRYFQRVCAIEQDPLLCKISSYNLHSRLGCANIDIIPESIRRFDWKNAKVDLIYIDPARRNSIQSKIVALQHLEPNIEELLPFLLPQARQITLKLSPLFDLREGIRRLPNVTKVQVISIDGECKEVVFQMSQVPTAGLEIQALIDRNGYIYSFSAQLEELKALELPLALEAPFLYEADVAIYKAGLESLLLNRFQEKGALGWTSKGGYLLAERILENFPGKGYAIEGPYKYSKRQTPKFLRQKHITSATFTKKNFPISTAEIYKHLQVYQKEDRFILFTRNKYNENIFFIGSLLK
jgi:hypothetical protein